MQISWNNCAKIGLTALAALVASPSVRAAGTEIVDTKGALVGLLDGQNRAFRQVPDGQWVEFDVEVGGLEIGLTPSFLLYLDELYGYALSRCPRAAFSRICCEHRNNGPDRERNPLLSAPTI
jgi:hypothetical protein